MQIEQFIDIQKIVASEILTCDEPSKYQFDHSFNSIDEVQRDCIPFIAPTQSTLDAAIERKHRKAPKSDKTTKTIKSKFDDKLRAEARMNEVNRLASNTEKMIVLDSTVSSYIEWRQKDTFTQGNMRGKVRSSGHNHDKLKIAKKEMLLQWRKMKAKKLYSVMICMTSAVRASFDNLPHQIALEMASKFDDAQTTAKNRKCLPEAFTRITHSQIDSTPDMHLIAHFDSKEKADRYYAAFIEKYDLGRTKMQEVDEGIIDYVCRQRAEDEERELTLLAWAWVWDVKLHSPSREDNRGALTKIKEGAKHSNRHRRYKTADLNLTPDLNSVLVDELDLSNTSKDEWFPVSDFYILESDELDQKLETTERTPLIVINTKTRRAHAQGSYLFSGITPAFCLPIRFLTEPRPQPVRSTACTPPAAAPKRMTRRELIQSLTRYTQLPSCRAVSLPSQPPAATDNPGHNWWS